MDDFNARLAHLLQCRGLGWHSVLTVLKQDAPLEAMYSETFSRILQKASPTYYKQTLIDLQSTDIPLQIQRYKERGIHLISIFDSLYPPLLKATFQPPWLLYAKGDWSLLKQEPKLAVVGSRQASEYGRRALETIFPSLIKSNVVIVSGLAKGVDTLAHRTAMKHGGNTIAVIAGGFDHIYPKENQMLADEMMKSQLILSEYAPNTIPSRWQFPMRNRIISGLSKGTFIIEAKGKSGSLITANYAVQEGRDVFALPGNIFSEGSRGTNELIQQGAKLIQSADDLIEELYY